MPPAGDQAGLVQRRQVLRHRAGRQAVPPGQDLGRGRLGQRLQQPGPGLAEQPGQRVRMPGAGGLPELGDPPGRVHESRVGRRVGHRGQARPDEHAGHEQQPGPSQPAYASGRAGDDEGAAGPAGPRVQVAEHAFQPVVGQRPGAERHVRVQEVAQPRPVRRDQELPASRQHIGEPGPGGRRVVEQPPGRLGHRRAAPLGQRPAHLMRHFVQRSGADLCQLLGDRGARPGRDTAEEVRGPPGQR